MLPRGNAWVPDRFRLEKRLSAAAPTIPTVATRAAMVREGVGAPGELLLQLAPEQPEGNVGGPVRDATVMLAGAWVPVRSAWGMKPPSTMAARTSTRDQRQRTDMVPM